MTEEVMNLELPPTEAHATFAIPTAAQTVSIVPHYAPTALDRAVQAAVESGNVDVMERLLSMQERVMAREAHQIYRTKLAEMLPELPVIEKKGKVSLGNNKGYDYAKWEDINPLILPILKKYGFSLNFIPSTPGEGKVTVRAKLGHEAGHIEEAELTLNFDTSGAKGGPQAAGSTLSYLKRYLASALLNLTNKDGLEADDDGRGGGGKITPAECAHLKILIEETNTDVPRFCKHFRIESLLDLPAKRYDEAASLLEGKKPPKGDLKKVASRK